MSIWSIERRSTLRSVAAADGRIPQQHDHDRLLFSTPVRRLANKTQVFPLDRNDAVRTRLTHSHEVANLARSMGDRIFRLKSDAFEGQERPMQAMLQAIGLAHDLGNPPFGHQGEKAISDWFGDRQNLLSGTGGIPKHLYPEFLEFEGNAQTIRIVTRLQVSAGPYGLDLTAGTLAALMKYPTSCDRRNKADQARKKYGYFESESEVVNWVRSRVGLKDGVRHPLTWIMEAADDIAFSSLDIEDSIKKRILSPDDMLAEIESGSGDEFEKTAIKLREAFSGIKRDGKSIEEIREIKASYFRTIVISHMIEHAVGAFVEDFGNIVARTRTAELLDGCGLCKKLKNTAFDHAFDSRAVRAIEADGSVAIRALMSFFWDAIIDRDDPAELGSRRRSARTAYGWTLISDNYRQNALRNDYKDRNGKALPMRYRELRLLTDMMAGMTDGYMMNLYSTLKQAGHLS